MTFIRRRPPEINEAATKTNFTSTTNIVVELSEAINLLNKYKPRWTKKDYLICGYHAGTMLFALLYLVNSIKFHLESENRTIAQNEPSPDKIATACFKKVACMCEMCANCITGHKQKCDNAKSDYKELCENVSLENVFYTLIAASAYVFLNSLYQLSELRKSPLHTYQLNSAELDNIVALGANKQVGLKITSYTNGAEIVTKFAAARARIVGEEKRPSLLNRFYRLFNCCGKKRDTNASPLPMRMHFKNV